MKSLKILTTILLMVFASSCSKQVVEKVNGPFLGMKPTQSPLLLAPDLIASSLDEYNGTFSADGKEFFFTTNTPAQGIISNVKMDDKGNWSKATIASFSGEFSEYDPLFSPLGDKLFFTSERPRSKTDSSGKTNIWYINKQDSSWGEPQYLDLGMPGAYYSSITNKGTIYFNVWDTGDMYRAVQTGSNYEVERLSDTLNSSNGEGDPFISPEEDYIIFRAYNNSLGRGDLFISYKIGENWTAPENLGEPINSNYHEMCPYVTPDGKFFIFSSNRIEQAYPSKAESSLAETRKKHQTMDNGALNIYYLSADFIKEKRRKYEYD